MSRNRERQQELQPGRVDYARTRLEALGYPVTEVNATTLQFIFRGSPVSYDGADFDQWGDCEFGIHD